LDNQADNHWALILDDDILEDSISRNSTMAAIGGAFAGLQYRLHKITHKIPAKKPDALKLGILSTAAINAMSIIYPSKTHPDVVLYAVASRDAQRAASFAKKYGFQKSYGSYQSLLDDPEVDIVYIPTPNSLHYEWASKSLSAGKHVLVEKPFTSNAEEARALVAQASDERSVDKHGNKLVLLEAFHWQFHPAAGAFADILTDTLKKYITTDDAEITTNAHMRLAPAPPDNDIRWDFDLAGGSLMDCAYALSFTRFALWKLNTAGLGHFGRDQSSLEPKVTSATAVVCKNDARVDKAMHASLVRERRFRKVTCGITTDMSGNNVYKFLGFIPIPRFWDAPSITVKTSKYEIRFFNALVPHVYHYITVRALGTGKLIEKRKQYFGGNYWGLVATTEGEKKAGGRGGLKSWSTYRYQLEAFVMQVRGKQPPMWISGGDSTAVMVLIDGIYEKAGLPVRESSPYLKERELSQQGATSS
jgi:predicted dehydrogenase